MVRCECNSGYLNLLDFELVYCALSVLAGFFGNFSWILMWVLLIGLEVWNFMWVLWFSFLLCTVDAGIWSSYLKRKNLLFNLLMTLFLKVWINWITVGVECCVSKFFSFVFCFLSVRIMELWCIHHFLFKS